MAPRDREPREQVRHRQDRHRDQVREEQDRQYKDPVREEQDRQHRGEWDKKDYHKEARRKRQECQHKHLHSYPLGL